MKSIESYRNIETQKPEKPRGKTNSGVRKSTNCSSRHTRRLFLAPGVSYLPCFPPFRPVCFPARAMNRPQGQLRSAIKLQQPKHTHCDVFGASSGIWGRSLSHGTEPTASWRMPYAAQSFATCSRHRRYRGSRRAAADRSSAKSCRFTQHSLKKGPHTHSSSLK